jgi:type II secretion system protein G
MRKNQNGFTLVEMLVVITIIGILAALAIPNMTKARNKAKEAEVKANLHVIQAALERFYTDNKQYPAYLGGGDQGGWYRFQQRMADAGEDARWLSDPLIEKGYIDISYPRNPFVNQAESINIVKLTGGNSNAGSGDPRFGSGGDIIGNGLDDPRFMNRTTCPGADLSRMRTLLNGQTEPYDIDILRLYWQFTRKGEAEDLQGILNYRFGGNQVIDINGNPMKVNDWWPGNFFYRSMGEIDMAQSNLNSSPYQVYNFRYSKYTTYMLGGYGSKDTQGEDVIRNILIPGQNFYAKPRAVYPNVQMAFPECYGGGDKNNNPVFPPKDLAGNDWIYGAPDGINDGVIMVLTGSGTKGSY